ncbi:MAG: tRNA pseudouridine(55) synthase TruB [Candidatus Saelkia tenebricola]|nr:tRNA pseudouridine(55) synthase TruB [Candidatus Saelkia tenebricola]
MSLNGILLVNKPTGITSHDVVDFIRKRFGVKKVGHGGTLDPLATGLLIIMIGKATKLSQKIIGLDKTYLAEMTLGFSTTTGDLAGEVIGKAIDTGYLKLTKGQIEEAAVSFVGEIDQVPPMYSAVKYQGKRLYKLARLGIQVPRASRKVKIYELTIENINLPTVVFDTKCSRGLYIRQLCVDFGLKLGYPAHLSKMVRTSVGAFKIDKAYEMNEIMNNSNSENFVLKTDRIWDSIIK